MNKEMLSQDYIDKICGGVYGKIIGIRLGIPFENHSSASLQREYDRIDSYPIYSDLTMPDDDNNGFVFFAKAFEMIGKPEHLSPEDAAYIILNYAWEKRGFFWWNKSTEFYGYLDRLHGMPCPEPGNGSDNVGGQIFYDAAGLVFAGQPEQAARCAEILSRVMHAGEGRIGAMFICACIITGVEFLAGCILNLWLKLGVWDYSNLPFNILGQICIPFTLLWYIISPVAIILDDYLRYWFFGEEKPRYKI